MWLEDQRVSRVPNWEYFRISIFDTNPSWKQVECDKLAWFLTKSPVLATTNPSDLSRHSKLLFPLPAFSLPLSARNAEILRPRVSVIE